MDLNIQLKRPMKNGRNRFGCICFHPKAHNFVNHSSCEYRNHVVIKQLCIIHKNCIGTRKERGHHQWFVSYKLPSSHHSLIDSSPGIDKWLTFSGVLEMPKRLYKRLPFLDENWSFCLFGTHAKIGHSFISAGPYLPSWGFVICMGTTHMPC